MLSNYQRLYDELIELISQEQVHNNLGSSLKARVERLISTKQTPQHRQKISHSCMNNYTEPQQSDMTKNFQKIVLKELHYQDLSNRKGSKVIEGTKYSKQQDLNKKTSKSKQRINSNDSHTYKQRSHQKYQSKYNTNQTNTAKLNNKMPSKQSLNSRSNLKNYLDVKEKSNSKLKTFNNKQNKGCQSKPEKKRSAYLKTETDSDFSEIVFTKNQTQSNRNTKHKETIKKLAGIQSVPSRFSVSNSKKASISLQKEKKLLLTIQQKKQQVAEEKLVLQDSIRMLQEKINKQRSLLNQAEGRTAKIQQKFNKVESYHKQKDLDHKISRKRSENFYNESRQLEDKIFQTTKNNDKIIEAISEQKYLIEMYCKVIDQMKSQLKVQKQQKTTLKKKVSQLKNTLKILAQKCESKQALSDQLFSSLQDILKKWN